MTCFLKNFNIIWCFYFWRVLLVITKPPCFWLFDFFPLHLSLRLVPHIHSSPYWFQENWHDHKKYWRFHQIPPRPLFRRDDAMSPNTNQFPLIYITKFIFQKQKNLSLCFPWNISTNKVSVYIHSFFINSKIRLIFPF